MEHETIYPEIDLWAAVMEQAVRDVKFPKPSVVEKLWTRNAISWFWSKNKRIGSFLWICENLGMDSESIINELRPYLKYNRT